MTILKDLQRLIQTASVRPDIYPAVSGMKLQQPAHSVMDGVLGCEECCAGGGFRDGGLQAAVAAQDVFVGHF